MYLKPSILLCEEDGMCKGSGRSVPGLDLHEALVNVSKHLEKYGGHAMAVGVCLKKENLEAFRHEKRQKRIRNDKKRNEYRLRYNAVLDSNKQRQKLKM